jgi:hypothetical protein
MMLMFVVCVNNPPYAKYSIPILREFAAHNKMKFHVVRSNPKENNKNLHPA